MFKYDSSFLMAILNGLYRKLDCHYVGKDEI